MAEAYRKAQLGASDEIPTSGTAFISVRDVDKSSMIPVVRKYVELGFNIVASRGTSEAIQAAGIACKTVRKVDEGRPHVVDMIKSGEIDLILKYN